MGKTFSYRDLAVWGRTMQLAENVYRTTARFPRTELYGLTSQLRRSAVSVPSNISEGHSRRSTKEFLRFISVALGSLSELETQLLLATRLGYATDAEAELLMEQASEIGRMLHGLRGKLEARLPSGAP